ncbi:PHP domain-containing protein [Candidatus Micrarchaeota archaeon]|nr:PHP domain-containing protein [Candidatus Micrarchaeota archaeon]MBU1166540.1 PHP domain-containing protein [Candidatus Micrarchaeota archaeon]MBU1887552.1 PHP domain-containing protein [Candidatus Micrarchaeota archaeon]
MIDLHAHTNASDGRLSLEELVAQAENAGLKAIAITDHDTIQNAKRIKEIKISKSNLGIELIPGIEISVYDYELNYVELHILGLFIDTENQKLNSKLKDLEKQRIDQKKATIQKLNELGYGITFEEIVAQAKGSVSRVHIARVLMEKYPNKFKSVPDAFFKLLDKGKPAFVSRKVSFKLKDTIDLIHEARGLAILCHPGFFDGDKNKLFQDFKKLGGDGVESVYDYVANAASRKVNSGDNEKFAKEFLKIAKEMSFLESGGSDFHGPNKGSKLGELDVPDKFLEKMKEHMKENMEEKKK